MVTPLAALAPPRRSVSTSTPRAPSAPSPLTLSAPTPGPLMLRACRASRPLTLMLRIGASMAHAPSGPRARPRFLQAIPGSATPQTENDIQFRKSVRHAVGSLRPRVRTRTPVHHRTYEKTSGSGRGSDDWNATGDAVRGLVRSDQPLVGSDQRTIASIKIRPVTGLIRPDSSE